ncbi:MAG: extracellular solute-binding protein [Pseudomonadota bacterium]
MIKKLLLAGAISVAATGFAYACENKVEIKSLSNAFPVYTVMTEAMAKCGNFQAEMDKDHRLKQEAALSSKPSLYQLTSVTNQTGGALAGAGLLRPLDDLIAKHGKDLAPSQLIKIDGKTIAVAAIVNTQHIMYREDVFKDLGLSAPKSWDDVLSAAKAIKDSGKVDYAFGGYYKTGWNLGFEFINQYLGDGGALFDDKNHASINNEKGVAVLERMKALSGYMDPEYLVSDTAYMSKQFQAGTIAMGINWASRAGSVNDPNESQVAGKIKMAAAPMGSARPSATLWWDGWAIAKNTSDEQAEAAFKLIIKALSSEVVTANNDVAIWTSPAFKPTEAASGAIATAQGGAANFPASKFLGALHTELGGGIADYMTGAKDAAKTLADIEAAYLTAAKENGLIK